MPREPITEYLRDELSRLLGTITAENDYHSTIGKVYDRGIVLPQDIAKVDFPAVCFAEALSPTAPAEMGRVEREVTYRVVVYVLERRNGPTRTTQLNRLKQDLERALRKEMSTAQANISAATGQRLVCWRPPVWTEQSADYKSGYGLAAGNVACRISYTYGNP